MDFGLVIIVPSSEKRIPVRAAEDRAANINHASAVDQKRARLNPIGFRLFLHTNPQPGGQSQKSFLKKKGFHREQGKGKPATPVTVRGAVAGSEFREAFIDLVQ